MNNSHKKITLKLSVELIEALDQYSKQQGKSLNHTVRDILTQALEPSTERLPLEPLQEIAQLKQKFIALENRVNQLSDNLENLDLIPLESDLMAKLIDLLAEHHNSESRNLEIESKIIPSNYLIIEDFLTSEENQLLLEYAQKKEAEFQSTTTTNNEFDYRRSKVLFSFPEFSQLITERLHQYIPQVLETFKIEPFEISRIESQLTAHNDNNFYKLHNDNGSAITANRELTYVYYFYQEPRQFSGGELVIYDSKIENNYYVATESSHTINPKNNSIIFFLSRYQHEVLPVICPSQNFAHSRFTVNGWIWR
jgi:SM-20-related protein